MKDHSNLEWYYDLTAEIAAKIEADFGVDLDDKERSRISDEIYRVIHCAKARTVAHGGDSNRETAT